MGSLENIEEALEKNNFFPPQFPWSSANFSFIGEFGYHVETNPGKILQVIEKKALEIREIILVGVSSSTIKKMIPGLKLLLNLKYFRIYTFETSCHVVFRALENLEKLKGVFINANIKDLYIDKANRYLALPLTKGVMKNLALVKDKISILEIGYPCIFYKCKFPKVTYFLFEYEKVTRELITYIAENFPALEFIYLTRTSKTWHEGEYEMCLEMFQKIPTLQDIDFEYEKIDVPLESLAKGGFAQIKENWLKISRHPNE